MDDLLYDNDEVGEACVVAGLVIRGNTRDPTTTGEISIKIHPCCNSHSTSNSSNNSCCRQVLESIRKFPRNWWLVPGRLLITSEREFDAVHAVRQIDSDLMKHILKPKLLAEIGKYYENENVRRKMWPEHARHELFIRHLKATYDYKQLEAIEVRSFS